MDRKVLAEGLALTGDPITFGAGSAQVLAQFHVENDRLVVEVGHVDGGGEGVLVALWNLASALGRRRKLRAVEWIVHATRCASPNTRLQGVLRARGFVVAEAEGKGQVFRLVYPLEPSP